MVTNKAVPECIAQQISRAETESQAVACVAALAAAAKSPPKSIAPFVEQVLRHESRANLMNLITRCDLADRSQAAAGPELRKKTIAHLQLPEWCLPVADPIADELLGWLHRTTLAKWQQQEPAWIERDHFVNQLHAILYRLKRQIARERAEHLIPVTDEKLGQEKGRPFVKQIYLVTDDDSTVTTRFATSFDAILRKAVCLQKGTLPTMIGWHSSPPCSLAGTRYARG